MLGIVGNAVLIVLVVLFSLSFFWLVVLKFASRAATRLGHSSPCPAAIGWIVNNPIRRHYMQPVLERVGIRPGEFVLELGPGPGAFSLDAARMVGNSGRLVAVDLQPEMIARLERRARDAGVDNIETHVASAYDLPLPDSSVDRAFLVTVLPEIPDRARALAELRRVLKPGGTLSITEEFLDPDYLFAGETIRLVESAGFRLTRLAGGFWIYTVNFEATGPNEKNTIHPRYGKKAGNHAQTE
ncbi:MAG: methyltransferase domain-containing protein [Anaerolineales bacterium]|nr:methyltransferase domain-containing protein [Anaerolineales bacterium]